MNEILEAISNHVEKFQSHVDTAKSTEADQKQKELAFFNAQIHWAGIQHKFNELSHNAALEFNAILKGFGINWMKHNLDPYEEGSTKDLRKEKEEVTPEVVQPQPQPQFLGDVPQPQETQEPTSARQEQETTQQTTP